MLFDKSYSPCSLAFHWNLNHLNKRSYEEVMIEILNIVISLSRIIIIYVRLYFKLCNSRSLIITLSSNTQNTLQTRKLEDPWASIFSRLFFFLWIWLGSYHAHNIDVNWGRWGVISGGETIFKVLSEQWRSH